jgi:hypothetical protein
MESIQRMVMPDSPLVSLTQQGVDAIGNIIAAAPSAKIRQGEPSSGNQSNDRANQARSEAASSASGNRRLADNDVHQWITQNCR